MDEEKIKKMIKEFKEYKPPMTELSKEIDEAEDFVRMDFSLDYLKWERLFLQNKLSDEELKNIKRYLDLTETKLSSLVNKIIPKTEEEEKAKKELEFFAKKMINILHEIVKI